MPECRTPCTDELYHAPTLDSHVSPSSSWLDSADPGQHRHSLASASFSPDPWIQNAAVLYRQVSASRYSTDGRRHERRKVVVSTGVILTIIWE